MAISLSRHPQRWLDAAIEPVSNLLVGSIRMSGKKGYHGG